MDSLLSTTRTCGNVETFVPSVLSSRQHYTTREDHTLQVELAEFPQYNQ